jgi:hypothetical protein
VGFVESETGYCSETYVTCGVDGTGEFSIDVEDDIDMKEEISIKVEDPLAIKVEDSIKVEEAIDKKEEVPEAMSFTPVQTEPEVRLRVS